MRTLDVVHIRTIASMQATVKPLASSICKGLPVRPFYYLSDLFAMLLASEARGGKNLWNIIAGIVLCGGSGSGGGGGGGGSGTRFYRQSASCVSW